MTVSPPTIVEERAAKRDGGFAIVVALLAFAVISPLARSGPVDGGTRVAVGALAVIALATIAYWVWTRRHPTTLVIDDDEIRLLRDGIDDDRRLLRRSDGPLRLASVGSARARTLVLSSRSGPGQIPLRYLDRDEVLDACHDHGWDLGDA